jgi:hypothetical protein
VVYVRFQSQDESLFFGLVSRRVSTSGQPDRPLKAGCVGVYTHVYCVCPCVARVTSMECITGLYPCQCIKAIAFKVA